ncbi:hypothetical protein TUMSATVNIG1_16530 [Vibrio nigripulchritudo]|uniref:helix-turn-helix domain-containing protein n=1 Tax=Vibrio nigripulchritudo TaxID=28173 RepID=UPI0019097D02|nr:XRE family transcriptional regulator [Vibrio nigripulchritudo]BCL69697.1 hypothetical protein VNTUMSATTG_16340 [Vibrio nigripulchritudo]BDU31044.1 hypothetical protein TUMSATVNIG1_16530 [Vibrio nigripulchritudo]
MKNPNCKYPITASLITEARAETGLTKAEFLEQHGINVTQATLSRWETGEIQVPLAVLIELNLVKPIKPGNDSHD